jgi:Arc/MetJ-type ribon-helix-helix transcriptional regulator
MPALFGHVPEDLKEEIEREMVENGRFDSLSDAYSYLIQYGFHNKYGN